MTFMCGLEFLFSNMVTFDDLFIQFILFILFILYEGLHGTLCLLRAL